MFSTITGSCIDGRVRAREELTHPSGTLIVTRNEAAQIRLFEVDAARGTERAIPADSATRLYGLRQVLSHSVIVAPMMAPDSWFNPLGLVDLKSDGQIVALRQGLNATIWTFTPESSMSLA